MTSAKECPWHGTRITRSDLPARMQEITFALRLCNGRWTDLLLNKPNLNSQFGSRPCVTFFTFSFIHFCISLKGLKLDKMALLPCLNRLIPSYFRPTLASPAIRSTISCTNFKFCRVLKIQWRRSRSGWYSHGLTKICQTPFK